MSRGEKLLRLSFWAVRWLIRAGVFFYAWLSANVVFDNNYAITVIYAAALLALNLTMRIKHKGDIAGFAVALITHVIAFIKIAIFGAAYLSANSSTVMAFMLCTCTAVFLAIAVIDYKCDIVPRGIFSNFFNNRNEVK